MKILFISAFPPCQKTAGQDYSRRLILDLVAKGHTVSIIYTQYPLHTAELPHSVAVLQTIKPTLKNCLHKPLFHPFLTKRFDKNTFLLLQELREPAVYNSIFEAIAGGASRINDIASKIHEEPQKCSKYLKTLQTIRLVKNACRVEKMKIPERQFTRLRIISFCFGIIFCLSITAITSFWVRKNLLRRL